jgi:acyl-CoA synthetase (NDP forming)
VRGLIVSIVEPHKLRKMFYPERVVVFGVSDSLTNLARTIVENCTNFGFKGTIYLVGRQGGGLGQRRIFRSLEEIDAVPDLAVLLIPADTIPATLDACGRKGIRHAVIETAGFSEFGEERRALEEEVLRIASRWGMSFMGPNCIGVINLETGLAVPFVPLDRWGMRPGVVSMIAQSGGIIQDILRRAALEHLALNKLASIGNKLMLDENDVLEFFISDPGTGIIGLYVEHISDGRRLMSLASSTDKPIIMLKANRSQSSREAAQFHTSALAGDDAVADAALRQAGIHRAETTAAMVSWFKIFTLPSMRGPKILAMARSGGQCVLMADAAQRYGLELVPLPLRFFDRVRQKVRAGVIRPTNPLDLGDVFDIDFYIELMELSLQEEGVDGLLFCHSFGDELDRPPTLALIKRAEALAAQYGKPVALSLVPDKESFFMMKETAYFPIFADADTAAQALAVSLRHFRSRLKSGADLPAHAREKDATAPFAPVPVRSPTVTPGVAHILGVREVLDLIRSYDIRVPDYALVKNPEGALEAARQMGYPVALKQVSPYLLHKTEHKAVQLNLTDDDGLRSALDTMRAEEYLVQKMVSYGYETIIGGKRDAEFGQVILFGMGGVLTEVFKDRAIRVLPIDETGAAEMINETKAAILLQGYRGQPAGDMKALATCLVRVSRLLSDHPEIVTIDINPLIVLQGEGGCVAVDARIECEK